MSNEDRAPTMTTPIKVEQVVERIVVCFSDKAILGLGIEEDDARLEQICDEMRHVVHRELLAAEAKTREEDAQVCAGRAKTIRSLSEMNLPATYPPIESRVRAEECDECATAIRSRIPEIKS